MAIKEKSFSGQIRRRDSLWGCTRVSSERVRDSASGKIRYYDRGSSEAVLLSKKAAPDLRFKAHTSIVLKGTNTGLYAAPSAMGYGIFPNAHGHTFSSENQIAALLAAIFGSDPKRPEEGMVIYDDMDESRRPDEKPLTHIITHLQYHLDPASEMDDLLGEFRKKGHSPEGVPFSDSESLSHQLRGLLHDDAARSRLLETIEYDSTVEPYKWLFMECLAEENWHSLVPVIARNLESWDFQQSKMSLLGAISVIRQHRVPDTFRDKIASDLRNKLTSIKGSNLIRTEAPSVRSILRCFKSFSTADDIELLSSFFTGPAEVKIAAINAAAHTIPRSPDSFDGYFDKNLSDLYRLAEAAALSRDGVPDIEALAMAYIRLFAARLGSESDKLLNLVEAFPDLLGITRLTIRKAEQALQRLGKSAWLESRRASIADLRTRLKSFEGGDAGKSLDKRD